MTLAAIAATAPDSPAPAVELLEPCLIADRLGLSEGYIRKLVKRGLAQDLPGFEKRGGRLFASPDAVRSLWDE